MYWQPEESVIYCNACFGRCSEGRFILCKLLQSQISLALQTRVKADRGWCVWASCPKEPTGLFFLERNVAIYSSPSFSWVNCMLLWMLLQWNRKSSRFSLPWAYITFTFITEAETDGHTPFLNTDVYRRPDGFSGHSVHRKPTYTNLYLNAKSLHHSANKLCPPPWLTGPRLSLLLSVLDTK